MIQEIITYNCSRCGSLNIVRNGHNKCGNPQYYCKDCGARRVLNPKQKHLPRIREQVLKVYRERMSLRGVCRHLNVFENHFVGEGLKPSLTQKLFIFIFFRGSTVERAFKVCRQTVMKWLQDYVQALPDLFETLLPAREYDVLELDEAWSFVAKKSEKPCLFLNLTFTMNSSLNGLSLNII